MSGSEQENCALARVARIRDLNDQLRRCGRAGRIIITRGVAFLGPESIGQIRTKLRDYDGFGPDNDPYHEHDMGGFEVDGHKLLWKIDYYDPQLEYGSEDPADPGKTVRILTIMLAEEY